MRKFIALLSGCLLALGLATTASAKTLTWEGTFALDLAALPGVGVTGTGVATINAGDSSGHLTTLRLANGLAGTGLAIVTDPDTTGDIPSVRLTATLGTGTISGIQTDLSITGSRHLPIKGLARVCTLEAGAGCGAFLPIQLTKNDGATGVGIGGLLTLFSPELLLSIQGQPWQLETGSGVNETANGAFQTLSRSGFKHGATSNNSSTALDSGVIQFLSPATVVSEGLPANNDKLSLFSTLTVHFVPEPGLLLLIGSGVVGLGLLGRSRLRK